MQLPPYLNVERYRSLICPTDNSVGLIQIGPTFRSAPRLSFYHNCPLCLFAALKRQCICSPPPDPVALQRLQLYIKRVIEPEIIELLKDFEYYYNTWYNHLTANQQDEVEPCHYMTDNELFTRFVKNFCKGEKQLNDSPIPPKNRCICAFCVTHKFVTGPVVYSLEQYFKKFKGYGGGKNWQETAELFNQWRELDYKPIQSDMSGLDRSVSVELKRLIFHLVYKEIRHKIHHVTPEIFDRHVFTDTTSVFTGYFTKDGYVDMGRVAITGTVFSGSMDTTLMNTLLTTIVNRFVMEELLGLSIDEYDLTNKGDDNVTAVPSTFNHDKIVTAYKSVFLFSNQLKNYYAPLYIRHGFGLTLKFCSISFDLCDIDYCSTNTFYCEQCSSHRITRKLDRFIYLTPWSNSALNLSPNQQLAYMQNLHDSNNKWMKNLPIFRALNARFATGVYTKYTLVGKVKKTLELTDIERSWYQRLFKTSRNIRIVKLQQQFGNNDAYSMVDRETTLFDCCNNNYYKWLQNKLGLMREEVDVIENSILTSDMTYESPVLEAAFDFHASYLSHLNYV